jgi:hypothetical protein
MPAKPAKPAMPTKPTKPTPSHYPSTSQTELESYLKAAFPNGFPCHCTELAIRRAFVSGMIAGTTLCIERLGPNKAFAILPVAEDALRTATLVNQEQTEN